MYNRKYRHNVYMFCGSIYDMNDCIIERPALLIDKSSGCIHGYGDAESLTAKFVKMAAAYNSAGMKDMTDDLLLMDFSNAWYKGMSNEEVCYVLRRAVEYTATSFQPALVEHCTQSDFQEWLRAEMQRFPIDLEEKEWS